MNDSANAGGTAPKGAVKSYKRDFWIKENQKHVPAHYRLQKAARIVSDIAQGRESDLLDVGCGPELSGASCPGISTTTELTWPYMIRRRI